MKSSIFVGFDGKIMETGPDTETLCSCRLIVTETTGSVLKRAGLSSGSAGDEIYARYGRFSAILWVRSRAGSTQN
jgi:hypothetical protein